MALVGSKSEYIFSDLTASTETKTKRQQRSSIVPEKYCCT